MKKINVFAIIGCFFGHIGEWNKIGIAYNGFGETEFQRTCTKCGKVQTKVF